MTRTAPFSRVLVANRGEVAVRVTRTLRRLGIASVAVHTPADDGARHVREADLAVAVGSYLDAEAIVAAALRTGAEAVHPGYGFLAESPVLARACLDAGLAWVGPGPAVLELMGDKIAAKAHVAALGVPVVPGVGEDGAAAGERDAVLAARADEVGYPLVVKPSAGGGGKGMQVVREPAALAEAIIAARRVAAAAFGDDTLLLERYVPAPRHVEAQVLGDTDGTVELVGLRECSLQRRHQKVVEEAPAPFPHGRVREMLGVAAVRIARSVDYVGAGTVELLVSGEDPEAWYFLEMNTRLQVEHPVTEEVTGLDLVEAQLRVAAGEPLPGTAVAERGHAVEARVYAERPERGFLPSTGVLLEVVEPTGVRVDSGVATCSRVTTDYDPMLLKVVASAPTREQALDRLDAALAQTVVLGVHTNIDYLRRLLATPAVRQARADTAFLDGFEPPAPAAPDTDVLAAAAAALAEPAEDGLWGSRSGWRVGEHRRPRVHLRAGEDVHEVEVPLAPPAGLRTAVEHDRGAVWVWRDGQVWELRALSRAERVERSRRQRQGAAPDPQLRTPMPGTVVALPVPPGERVAPGDVVAVVEAMKMENPVTAPVPGILDLAVRQGDVVTADQLLATIHADPHGPQDTGAVSH